MLFYDSNEYTQVRQFADVFVLSPVVNTTQLLAQLDGEGLLRRNGFYLYYHDDRLTLCRGQDTRGVWVRLNDIKRRLQGEFSLARACGNKTGSALDVLDVTAGLGIDALALRARGNRLTLIEREPLLWALLSDLLRRADAADVALHHMDAKTILAEQASFDVVYVDPMFTQRRKTALPNKRMQYLGELLHEPVNENLADFIEQARRVARNRVVLKRRLRDPEVLVPDWQIRGKTIRYDVFRGSRNTA